MSPRVRHWVRVILVSLGLTIAVSLVLGMTYEAVASARDAKRFPQIGQTYNGLNLYCSGSGSPAVILESGLGVPGYGWYRVQPEVAKFAKTCWYDRAGYGWSARATTTRDSRTIAKELHALLGAAGVAPPYVLVGHSFGGYNIRVFHGMYPGEVAGLVFVDSSHEDQEARMSPKMRSDSERIMKLSRLLPVAINIGLVRFIGLFKELPLVSDSVQGEPRRVLQYLALQPRLFRATSEEFALFGSESARQVRESGNLGDKPVIVLTAGKFGPYPEFGQIWKDELQPSLARLSTRGKRVMVEDSSHMIPYERPDAVVSAVREVVEAVRAGGPRRD